MRSRTLLRWFCLFRVTDTTLVFRDVRLARFGCLHLCLRFLSCVCAARLDRGIGIRMRVFAGFVFHLLLFFLDASILILLLLVVIAGEEAIHTSRVFLCVVLRRQPSEGVRLLLNRNGAVTLLPGLEEEAVSFPSAPAGLLRIGPDDLQHLVGPVSRVVFEVPLESKTTLLELDLIVPAYVQPLPAALRRCNLHAREQLASLVIVALHCGLRI